MTTMTGWVCPLCGAVYAPHVETCVPCTTKAQAAPKKSPKLLEHPDLDYVRSLRHTPGMGRID